MIQGEHKGKRALLLLLLTLGLTAGSLASSVTPADARWVRRFERAWNCSFLRQLGDASRRTVGATLPLGTPSPPPGEGLPSCMAQTR